MCIYIEIDNDRKSEEAENNSFSICGFANTCI